MSHQLQPPSGLLDPPVFPRDAYAPLADRLKKLLGTGNDLIFVQAEAIVALEASARSLGRPGLVALNVVTSPYGKLYGQWLRASGAVVHELTAASGRPVQASDVEAAIDGLPELGLLAVVHAETSTGILNPLPAIAAMAKSRGALLVVDAVASVGGHQLDVEALGIDVCVGGAQKALAGPTGVSFASVSARAWAAMALAPRLVPSVLDLLELKAGWIDKGRGALPGMPPPLEFWALEAALQRVEKEGLASVIARHEAAMHAVRQRLSVLGLDLWVSDKEHASTLATSFVASGAFAEAAFMEAVARAGIPVLPCHGELPVKLLRFDHAGLRAKPEVLDAHLNSLARLL